MRGEIRIGWKEYIAQCEKCGTEEVLHWLSRRDAERAFRSGGWKRVRGKWICELCSIQKVANTSAKWNGPIEARSLCSNLDNPMLLCSPRILALVRESAHLFQHWFYLCHNHIFFRRRYHNLKVPGVLNNAPVWIFVRHQLSSGYSLSLPHGGRGWTRTSNWHVMSVVFFQLNYSPKVFSGVSPAPTPSSINIVQVVQDML